MKHPLDDLGQEPVASRYHSFLIEGPSGVGKTTQFRRMVESGLRGMYISSEEKLPSLAGLNPGYRWYFPVRQVDFPHVKADKSPARSDLLRYIEALRTADQPFDFVFWDSPFRWCEDLLEYLTVEKNLSGQEMWGIYAKKVEAALKAFTGLTSMKWPKPMHVVAVWGVEMDKNWLGERSVVPLMDGQKTKPKINYYFDHVLMFDKLDDPIAGASKYVAYTTGNQSGMKFSAKISSGGVKFDPIITSPNLVDIIKILQSQDEATIATTKGQTNP